MKLSGNSYWQSLFLSGGTILNSLLGLVFYVLVARSLGLENFGYFSFLLGLGLLAAELGDLGLGSALIKFGPGIFPLAFLERIIIGIIIILIFIIPRGLFIYSASIAISLLFFSLITQSFLAKQKYFNYIAVNLFSNLVRLLIIFYLMTAGLLTVVSGIVAFCLANGIAFLVGLFILRDRWFLFKEVRKNIYPVFVYSRWLALSYGVTSLAAKIDIPLLFLLGGAQITGIYSSAQKLLSVFSQLAGSLEGVFAPKLSSLFSQKKAFRDYFLISVISVIGIFLTIFFSGTIIPFIFGNKYLAVIPVFNWLLLGMGFFFLSGPFTAVVLYQKGKSFYHLIGSVTQLAITTGFFLVLIPRLGIWGAVASFIFSQFFNLGYYLLVWQDVRNRS